jgi:hypothetical protein
MLNQATWVSPIVLALAATSALSGCAIPVKDKDGTAHHIVIGFGIVSVHEPKDKAIVTTKTEAIGLSISDQAGLKFGLGYSSGTVVTVADGAEDVRVEVSQRPWYPFIVDTQSAILRHITDMRGKDHDEAK